MTLHRRNRRDRRSRYVVQAGSSPADVPAMVSIMKQGPRSDYFVATHAGVPAGGGGIAPLAEPGEETCELQR